MIWKCCLLCLIAVEFNEEKSVIILLLRQCCYYQAVEELREIWISHSFWQEDGQLVYFWLTSEEFLRFSLLCYTTEYLIFIDFNFEEKKKKRCFQAKLWWSFPEELFLNAVHCLLKSLVTDNTVNLSLPPYEWVMNQVYLQQKIINNIKRTSHCLYSTCETASQSNLFCYKCNTTFLVIDFAKAAIQLCE